MDTDYKTSLYTLLYQAIIIFNKSMISFVVGRLEKHFGNDWWDLGVLQALDKNYAKRLGVRAKSPGRETHLDIVRNSAPNQAELLDMSSISHIIQFNWEACFSSVFSQSIETVKLQLKEIMRVRNAVTHPSSKMLSEKEAIIALDYMIEMLQPVDPVSGEKITQLIKISKPTTQQNQDALYLKHIYIPLDSHLSVDKYFEDSEAIIKSIAYLYGIYMLIEKCESKTIKDYGSCVN